MSKQGEKQKLRTQVEPRALESRERGEKTGAGYEGHGVRVEDPHGIRATTVLRGLRAVTRPLIYGIRSQQISKWDLVIRDEGLLPIDLYKEYIYIYIWINRHDRKVGF